MESIARLPNQLGAALRLERQRLGMTQAELGKTIRLRQATISKLESGKSDASLETILRVLSALNLELVVRSRTKGTREQLLKLLK